MIEFILLLLGLAFPSSDNNTVISDNQNSQTIVTTQSDGSDSDTKGNTGQTPPPAPTP